MAAKRKEPRHLPAITDPLPPIPTEAQAIWDRDIVGPTSRVTEKTSIALAYWLNGYSWRECSEIVGWKDETCKGARRVASQTGLYDVAARTDRLIGQSRRIAAKAGEELERRLTEKPEDIDTKQLAVVRGIEIDKVATREGWRSKGAQEGPSYVGALTELAEQLRSGDKVSLKLEVSKESDAIDVTPESVED